MDDKPISGLTIKTVSDRTGISVHTLRAWERRYGVPKPRRVPNNRYRLYDEQDIADVLWMKQQIEAGVAPAQASQMLAQHHHPATLSLAATSPLPLDSIRTALLTALSNSDQALARRLLDEVFARFAPEQAMLQLIAPVMREIGERWLRNEMDIWQEHLASNLVRQKLLAVLQAQPMPPAFAPHLVATCAPSEEHELGLLMVALLARQMGWGVSYLGASTPLSDLAKLVHVSKPRLIAISVSTVMGLAGLIPLLAHRFDAPLVFGGRLLNTVPHLREHLPGTFLGEDALTAARNLVEFKPRADIWSPSKNAWNATQALQSQRLKIAADVAMQLVAGLPANVERKWQVPEVGYAGLFLVDALACALGYDTPELMDMHQVWLKQAMPPRDVPIALIAKHIAMTSRMIEKNLDGDHARRFKPLLDRLATSLVS